MLRVNKLHTIDSDMKLSRRTLSKNIFRCLSDFSRTGEGPINFDLFGQFQIDYQIDMLYILTTKND